jgi:uncharacterized UBP type Zn finger protein
MLVTPGPIISGTMGEKGATLVVSSPLAGLRKLVDSESISLAGFVGSSALSGGRRTTDYGAKKRTLFTKLPNVLILSLGRFDHLGRKITKQVEATDPLQIPDQCLTPALKTSLQGNRPTYRLLHVVHHSGRYIGGGHYTSYARLPGFGAWYKHDDAERAASRRTAPGPQALQWGLNTGFIYVYVRV